MKYESQMHLEDISSQGLKKAATREGAGLALAEVGEKDSNVWAGSSDVTGSVQLHHFQKKFPGRFFQVGVAEQNLATVAAGLSYSGKTVFIAAYGIFSPGRNWEQIRTAISYGNANVKIIGSHTGLNVGPDGATHQALEDIAITRCMANMTIISPCDAVEAKKAVHAAWKGKGPFYIRCTRDKVPAFTTEKTPFEIGKMNLLCDGSDVAVIATGGMVYEALCAAEILEKQGISAAVANMHTISSPDKEAIGKLAKQCGLIVTIEEHNIKGGLGGAVCETVAETCPARVKRLGMEKFGESGDGPELLKKYGLEREGIAKSVEKELKNIRG